MPYTAIPEQGSDGQDGAAPLRDLLRRKGHRGALLRPYEDHEISLTRANTSFRPSRILGPSGGLRSACDGRVSGST